MNSVTAEARVGLASTLYPSKLRHAIRWAATLAWAGNIFRLSTSQFGGALSEWLLRQLLAIAHLSLAPMTFAAVHFLFRKLAHVTEYAILGALLYASLLRRVDFEWNGRVARWSVVIAALYSLTDEFHQMFEPGRGPSLIDCGIDTVGAAVGILMVYLVCRLRYARRRSTPAVVASAAET